MTRYSYTVFTTLYLKLDFEPFPFTPPNLLKSTTSFSADLGKELDLLLGLQSLVASGRDWYPG